MQSAHYFPVEPKPFAMRAGLIKFPTDFGNGEADHRIFQVDGQPERALHEKRAPRVVDRYFEGANTPAEARALDAALTLAERHLHADAPERLEAARADVRRFTELGLEEQDLTITGL